MYHTTSPKGIPGVVTTHLFAQFWCRVVQYSLLALPSRSDLFFPLIVSQQTLTLPLGLSEMLL